MTEEQARKIGGKYGAHITVSITIVFFISFCIALLSDGTLIDNDIVPEFLLFQFLTFLIILFSVGGVSYWIGKRFGGWAGVSIIIKGRNYLSIGYLSVYGMFFIYSLILLLFDTVWDNFGNADFITKCFEDVLDTLYFWLGITLLYSIPVSLLGFWLGNKIDNERIKHLSTKNQESNYSANSE